ncbi:EamA family transporter [Kribbella sp. NPDC051952]|uniref:EamA family transporter n=1 Tax=Kribbella sp. NPDC051952 TaxID=3154851 RepID=UPI003446C567
MHHPVARSTARGLLYVVIAGLAWGTGGPTGALLFQYTGLDSTAVSFWRLAAAALWLALARRILRRGRLRHGFAPRYLFSGLGLALCQLGYFAAIPRVGVAVATVIALGAGPLFIALGARERVTSTLALAVIGLALLVSGGQSGSAEVAGIAFALLSAAGYALTTLLNRTEADPITGAFLGFAYGAAILLPLTLTGTILPTHIGWPLIAYFGLVPTALAYTLFYAGLTTLRASTAAVVALIEPAVAATLGVLLFHEHLTPRSLAGIAVLLAAVLLQALRE